MGKVEMGKVSFPTFFNMLRALITLKNEAAF